MIKRSKLVVGDVEGLRPEVLFELGFSNGLKTPVLPVVSGYDIKDIPYWLRSTQLGSYSSGPGIAEIVGSIETYMAQSGKAGTPRSPVSSLVVWLRRFAWNENAFDQLRAAARREGITFEAFEETDSEDAIVEKAYLSTFLIISLDGTDWDGFGHFVCGTALSKPFAGYSAKRLDRRIVILEPPEVQLKKFTAEGVSRCSETVVVTKPEKLLVEFERFLERRKEWEGG